MGSQRDKPASSPQSRISPEVKCQLVEVALPVPLDNTFSYRHLLADGDDRVLEAGDLVAVPFGRRKQVLGMVLKVAELDPDAKKVEGFALKNVSRVFGPEYRIVGDRWNLARWLAAYYSLPIGQVVPLFHPPSPGTKRRRSKIAIEAYPTVDGGPVQLTAAQKDVLETARDFIERKAFGTVLLHGVTGSGKTEVYLTVMQEAIALGRDALFLLPEIALTPQTLTRIQTRFGDRVAAIHSGLSAGERCQVHEAAARGEINVVVGPRSALFVPLKNLGVIVVDEEHETSYKQDDTPRYHARHAALIRGRENKAVVILGSATPDLESMQNAVRGRYVLKTLPERMGGQLPPVSVVDMRGISMPEGFSPALKEAMDATLAAGEQVILYYNRRGFARVWQCCDCGDVVECPNCDIALTYHLRPRRLLCHYCDFHREVPAQCEGCSGEEFLPSGGGTEKVELNLQAEYPGARILRLDHDTTRGRGSHQKILAAFARREADILVGTQMVAKGHHFPGVSLVGVLAADHGLGLPDFRASERSFQLLTQVAGRSGRTGSGRVVFQTYQPEHPVILAASGHDYTAFLESELPVRKALGYPPYRRLMRVALSGRRLHLVEEAAGKLATALTSQLGSAGITILGPAPAVFSRLNDRYRYQILLKGTLSLDQKSWLRECLKNLKVAFPQIDLLHDYDPVSVY
jgi:primosomal protein N' (replication factor Y) (superfamily II helicase)